MRIFARPALALAITICMILVGITLVSSAAPGKSPAQEPWSTPQILTGSGEIQAVGASATNNDKYFLAWEDQTLPSIYYSFMMTNTWRPPDYAIRGIDPAVAAAPNGQTMLFVTRFDEGTNRYLLIALPFADYPGFYTDVTCTQDANAGNPSLVVLSDNTVFYVNKEGNTIYQGSFPLSNPDNRSCEPLTTTAGPVHGDSPYLTVSPNGQTLHVVWTEDGQVLYMASTDRGHTWGISGITGATAPLTNFSGEPGDSILPRLLVDDKEVLHLVWVQNIPDQPLRVYYTNSSQFLQPTLLSNAALDGDNPVVAEDRFGYISVIWTEGSNDIKRIVMRQRTPGDTIFGALISVTDTEIPGLDNPVAIAMRSTGDILSAWSQTVGGSNRGLFYTTSKSHFLRIYLPLLKKNGY
ncbi:MAG: hypothetical protein HY326_11775 [Chloroflexi bacterium]|nr:hypothetical protein [Chloroflexota bacterium]